MPSHLPIYPPVSRLLTNSDLRPGRFHLPWISDHYLISLLTSSDSSPHTNQKGQGCPC